MFHHSSDLQTEKNVSFLRRRLADRSSCVPGPDLWPHLSIFLSFVCFFWAFFSFLREEGTVFSFFFCVLVENSGVLWLPASLPSGDAVLLSSLCPERWQRWGSKVPVDGHLLRLNRRGLGLKHKCYMWAVYKDCFHSTYVGATTEHADLTGSTDTFVRP